MKKTPIAFALAVALAIVAACVERGPARFPHQAHLTGTACAHGCLSCNTCHTPSQDGRESKLPELSLCTSCHQHDATRISKVLHVKPERPSGPIIFDHDQHLAMPEIRGQCVGCHAGVVENKRPPLPPMSQCLTCHEHQSQWDAGQCTPCHAQRDLKQLMPRTFLRHDQNFARRHGTLALEQKQLCQACHTQADCDGCHDTSQGIPIERRLPERIERTFVHRGNFLSVHALEAQAEPSRCLRCHEKDSCDGCHTARGVSGALSNGRNPHPPGWVGVNTLSSDFHGRAARRDILACASCHDQGPATNCIRCHRVGAYGGNPHPAGRWPSSRDLNEPMCRYCHE
ncbi:MAG: cytochrome c3 family protein [Myxococcota bacterium]